MTKHSLRPRLHLGGSQGCAGIHWLMESRLDFKFVFICQLKQNLVAFLEKKSSSPLAAKVSKRLAIWLLQISSFHTRKGPCLTEGPVRKDSHALPKSKAGVGCVGLDS